jgi:Viral BACON domain/Putative binding domain, N-terminal
MFALGVVGICAAAMGACEHDSPTAPTVCSVTIAPLDRTFTADGGTGTVTVTTAAGCAWSATAGAAWVAITSGQSGVGPGTLTYAVAANPGPEPRTGTLGIDDQRHTITESGRPPVACDYALAPPALTFDAGGGTGSVAIATAPQCPWSAAASAAWIDITSGRSGAGPGAVMYSVAANPTADPRTGTLTIQDQHHTIAQGGRPPIVCEYDLAPESAEIESAGAEGRFSVLAPAGCDWSAVSTAPWLVVRSGSQGSGNGDVSYAVGRNPSSEARHATIAVANQIFTVRQAGDTALCRYSVAPVEFRPCMPGGSVTATLTADANCPWTVTSGTSWLSLPGGGSGTSSGAITIAFSDNYDAPREGIIELRWPTPTTGQNIHVRQAGCSYAVTQSAFDFTSAGGSGTFEVFQQSDPVTCGGPTQDRCVWTARADVTWITITTGMPRAGDGRVAFSLAANETTAVRVGRITVRDKVVVVSQAGR